MSETREQSVVKERDPQVTTIYLLRHAPTPMNKEHRLQGWQDEEVNQVITDGVPTHFTALNVDTLPQPDVVYASRLGRSYQTAQMLIDSREWDVPLLRDPNLDERNFGDEYSGRTAEEIRDEFMKHPELVAQYPDLAERTGQQVFSIFDEADVTPTNGETRPQVKERYEAFFRSMHDQYPGGIVVAVGHGGAIASLGQNSKVITPITVGRDTSGEYEIKLRLPAAVYSVD